MTGAGRPLTLPEIVLNVPETRIQSMTYSLLSSSVLVLKLHMTRSATLPSCLPNQVNQGMKPRFRPH